MFASKIDNLTVSPVLLYIELQVQIKKIMQYQNCSTHGKLCHSDTRNIAV